MLIQNENIKHTHLDDSPLHLLHQAGQCAGDIFLQRMKDAGITRRQYTILRSVANNEGLNQTDHVLRTGIDRSTLADIVRRMEDKALIRRERQHCDARAYAVYMTEKGHQVLIDAAPAAADVDQKLLAALPVEERENFIRSLNRLVENFHPIYS